jgi:hypothetical protein
MGRRAAAQALPTASAQYRRGQRYVEESGWRMTRALQVAGLVLLVGLCAIVWPVAMLTIKYGPETAKAVKDGAVRGDGLVGEARLMVKKDVEVSNDLDALVKDAGPILWKFDDVADVSTETIKQAGTTIVKVGGVADAAKGKIDDLDVKAAQAKANKAIDDVIDEIQDVGSGVDDALSSIRPAAHESFVMLKSLDSFLNGPLTFATNNAGEFEDTINLTVDQGRKRWVAPYSGNHPKAHAIWGVTSGLIGTGATLWRNAK